MLSFTHCGETITFWAFVVNAINEMQVLQEYFFS
jgi:hypothetical protein